MKILMSFSHFPVSIPRYFLEAFRDLGHTVWTTGLAFGNWIPWTAEGAKKEGMNLPEKYVLTPTMELYAGAVYTWNDILDQLPEPPDLVIHHPAPAGAYAANIAGRPPNKIPYALLFSDPHVLEWYYKTVRYDADFCFNMQDYYKQEGDYYIPYAYSEKHHYIPYHPSARDLDVACIGLQYSHRRVVMDELGYRGRKVFSRVGFAFDEYREIYNGAKVAFSWSSHLDTIARVFEAPQMGAALVTNLTPDLYKFFHPHEVTVFRGGVENALFACEYLLDNPEKLAMMAQFGYKATVPHTYRQRCEWMLNIVETGIKATEANRNMERWLKDVRESRVSNATH